MHSLVQTVGQFGQVQHRHVGDAAQDLALGRILDHDARGPAALEHPARLGLVARPAWRCAAGRGSWRSRSPCARRRSARRGAHGRHGRRAPRSRKSRRWRYGAGWRRQVAQRLAQALQPRPRQPSAQLAQQQAVADDQRAAAEHVEEAPAARAGSIAPPASSASAMSAPSSVAQGACRAVPGRAPAARHRRARRLRAAAERPPARLPARIRCLLPAGLQRRQFGARRQRRDAGP